MPLNTADFRADVRDPNLITRHFRLADLLVQPQGDRARLFASHHYWNRGKQCLVVRISAIEITRAELMSLQAPLSGWRTLFETTPCLRRESLRSEEYPSVEMGGRMALLNEQVLIFSIGDHGFDGRHAVPALPQDLSASYGKIIQLHLDDGSFEVYSRGHRNPQGLYVEPTGIVWSTEHGPSGGDELNQIREGGNYGWPLATYGTEYGMHEWPPAEAGDSGGSFEEPFFAWVPSIGVSSLIGIRGDLFQAWRGDLLISSLTGRALWRTRIRDDRVVLAEPIAIGQRIRDLIEDQHGRLILWTDNASLIFVEPIVAPRSGQELFGQCVGCHNVFEGEEQKFGPTLHDVVNRRVASGPYRKYSPALVKFGGVWTKSRLDAFLASPQAAVPGTWMQFEGIADQGQRQAIIEYLESLDSEGRAE